MIETSGDLVEAIIHDPWSVAASMQRIHRFGGQRAGCDVLAHSVEVAHRIAPFGMRLTVWALLHDAHEIITGDVVRLYKSYSLNEWQRAIDDQLIEELLLGLSERERAHLTAIDVAVGNEEYADAIEFQLTGDAAAAWFVDTVQRWVLMPKQEACDD